MEIFSLLVSLLFVGFSLALPASNEQLDKATINDYDVNSVSEDQRVSLGIPQYQQQNGALSSAFPPSTVEISGISNTVQKEPVEHIAQQQQDPTKPAKPAGSAFARFIDDIFQIPISVLQNVAKLITNPFTQAKKDAAVSAQLS